MGMIRGVETGSESLWRSASQRPELWLQLTDWKWLSALEVYGILGLGQMVGLAMVREYEPGSLVRLFFNDIKRSEHWLGRAKRVRKLVDCGYIQAQRFPHRLLYFTLSEKGHLALEEAGLARLHGFRHRISESMVNHESMAAGVGLVLGELMGLEVLTARERVDWKGNGGRPPSDSRTVPDLWIVDAAEPKGVELERGPKAKEEYRARWRNLRLILPENGLLLYLTTWPGGKRFILELAQDYHADFVLAAGLDEFLQAHGLCRFAGIQPGRSLVLQPHTAFPYVGTSSRRVPAADPLRQDVSAGSGPAAGPFAAPSQRWRVGTLTQPPGRLGQSAPPPASGSLPRPLPLLSPSPTPEGDGWSKTGLVGTAAPRTTGGMDQ